MVKVTRPGIALSATGLCIARPGVTRPSVTRLALATTPGDNGSWPELANALRDAAPGGDAADLAVALLPPLVEVRRLALPPMIERDLLQLLTRNAARYFVTARGSQTVGARQWRGERGAAAPVLAAAAPARFVAAIHAAVADGGWTLSAMSPAEGAWAAAAIAIWPAFARRTAHVLVHEDDRIVVVELDRGEVANVRRFRGGAADSEKIVAAILESQGGGSNAAVGAFGSPGGRHELVRALGGRGIAVSAIPSEWQEYTDAADVMAALYAGASAGPALFCVIAAGLELWGVHRELAAVEAERAAIRPQVSATLIGRSSLEDAYRRLATIAEAQRSAPRWAPVLAELTARLPEEAYFTTVRTRGDSLTVDGMASSAVKVFAAIEASPHLQGVRAPAQVRRQAPEGGDPMERFTLAATLPGTKDSAAATPKASRSGGKAP